MILHRLRLTDFRGVRDREVCFPERGVVVVCGPNEIGKSSMLEALDLLLTYRDRSSHRDVKGVKPANADVGARVEAEISTGPYRFVYRKQFHKRPKTELDVSAPRREHLTGDEAHERVAAMLAETLDTKLWDAQRVLQSPSDGAVSLSGCDALSRALDAAAGEAASPGGDSLLVDRVDAEFLRYFTATGRPTGVWKAAIDRLGAADAEVGRRRLAVEEVDERVARHESLTARARALDAALAPAAERLAAARAARGALGELGQQLDKARSALSAAESAATRSALADAQRRQLVAEAARRGDTLAGLRATAAEAAQREAGARSPAEAAATAAAVAAAGLDAAQRRLEAARAVADACSARAEADRLAARVLGIDEIDAQLAAVAGRLAAATLTDAGLAGIERRQQAVRDVEAALRAVAGAVEFTAPADLEIVVDGRPRTLRAGQRWAQPASAPVTVDVPGVLSVRVDPGASAGRLSGELTAAQQDLARELAAAGVPDVAAARELAARRRELADSRATLAATRAGLCAGEDAALLRGRLAGLRAVVSAAGEVDAEAAAAELAGAQEGLRQARADADARRAAAAEAAGSHTAAVTELAVQRHRLDTADAEFAAARGQLAAARAVVPDTAVAGQAAADADARGAAEQAATALAERYRAADPAGVEAELAAAAEAAEAIAGEVARAERALRDLAVELAVIGGEGRQGRLDEAEAEAEHARAEHRRVRRRAEAARLLRDTMSRHRDNTRRRYVQPYRAELERLGREVFGPSFEVDLDTELAIQTRTLDGRTVAYDSLSGGAREQLGILARLAGAALVAADDTVPVVIDDALGFSDPDRLAKMGAVLGSVGGRGQVIVLTCTPGRYDGVADAHVIELTA